MRLTMIPYLVHVTNDYDDTMNNIIMVLLRLLIQGPPSSRFYGPLSSSTSSERSPSSMEATPRAQPSAEPVAVAAKKPLPVLTRSTVPSTKVPTPFSKPNTPCATSSWHASASSSSSSSPGELITTSPVEVSLPSVSSSELGHPWPVDTSV